MAGLNGPRGPNGRAGSPSSRRSPPAPTRSPEAAPPPPPPSRRPEEGGAEVGAEVAAWVAQLGARAVGASAEELLRDAGYGEMPGVSERALEQLQKASKHKAPGLNDGRGVTQRDLNRQLRRVRKRRKHFSKAVQRMIERHREKGADPDWKPEAFPELDWRIRSEIEPVRLDTTGRKARILAAGLPPAQAERLVREAKRIAEEHGIEDGYRTMRWRDLVAAAWASWRLSRPVRASDTKPAEQREAQTGDEALGYEPPKLGVPAERVKRPNPWAGGRVVDGYAREAFCLLMRNLLTGQPLANSTLFYTNGSGTKGVFGYLATPAPEGDGRRRSRALDGELGLYSRWQPPAWKSKFVGPPKLGPDGKPLLDAHGNVQRYALAEHWYHARMCGRRAVAQADRGSAEARGVLRELCPWLFAEEPQAEQLLEDVAQREAAMEGGEPPSPAPDGELTAEAPTTIEPPD